MVTIQHLDPSTPFDVQLQQKTGTIAMIETIFVPRERMEEFLSIWKEDASYMKAQKGFISTQLHRGTADSQLLVNVAIWESTEALFNAFSSPEFQSKAAQYVDSIVGYPHVYERIAIDGVCVD